MVCDPSVSVYKGYSLSKDAEDYLASRGLKNAIYTIISMDIKEDLFGALVPCPFQQPGGHVPSTSKASKKASVQEKPLEEVELESNAQLDGSVPLTSEASKKNSLQKRSQQEVELEGNVNSLEMDDDDDVYSSKNTLNPPSDEKEKPNSSLSECKTVAFETVTIEKPCASPESKPATSFASNEGVDLTTRVSDGPHFAGKDAGLTFTTAAPSISNPPQLSSASQSPSLLNPSVLAKEQTGFPSFSFDSKSSDKGPTNFTISSMVSIVGHALSLNSGAGSDSKLNLLNSNAGASKTSPVTPPEAITSDQSDKTQQVGNLYGSLDNAASSGVSTSTMAKIFSFGASTKLLRSNSLPMSSAISGSAFGLSSSSSFSTGHSSFSSSSSTSFAPSGIPDLFGSSSQPATASIFSSGSSSSSPTGFSFRASTNASGSAQPAFGLSLGASSGSLFSTTSAASAAASSSSGFSSSGMSNPIGFGSPAAAPPFGQQANTPSSSNFIFGSPTVPLRGPSLAHQNTLTPQNPSPFPATGNLEFPTGGSFSLGGGCDKSNRKIVKVHGERDRCFVACSRSGFTVSMILHAWMFYQMKFYAN